MYYKLKTPKAIENTVIKAYKSIENGVVGAYKKVECKFIDTFLERVEQPGDWADAIEYPPKK